MAICVSPLTESDIPGATAAIQEAFANDPYNLWVFNDRKKVNVILSLHLRLVVTLGILSGETSASSRLSTTSAFLLVVSKARNSVSWPAAPCSFSSSPLMFYESEDSHYHDLLGLTNDSFH